MVIRKWACQATSKEMIVFEPLYTDDTKSIFNRFCSKILKVSYRLAVMAFLPLFLVLIIYPESQLLLAAEAPEPFSTVAVRISGSVNSNQNAFHEFWEPEFGAELLSEMPFYLGDIQAGVHLYPYSGRSSYQPNFLSVYVFVGWGLGLRLSPGIRWYNGLQIGSYQMSFDDSDIDESYWLAYADTNVYLGIGHYVQMYYLADPRMADRL
jgi:hypothetical protein